MDRQARLESLDKKRLWHPFTQMQSFMREDLLIIERGEGACLFDVQGRRYLDGVSSLWTNVHGHRHPSIDAAVRAQLDKIAHTTLLGLGGEASIEFADLLAGALPGNLTRIFYSDNGSTAVEVAVKMAYVYQERRRARGGPRRRFVTFEGAYHGDTLGSVSVGGIDLFHSLFRPLLFETVRLPYPFCYRCPLGLSRSSCGEACMERIEYELHREAETCAAVVIEPLIQGAAGMRPAPRGFLRLLRRLCDELDLVLIADEVATGFGRTGTMFACEQEGVRPDILALAKGIAGGYLPLAVTAAAEKIFEAFLGRPEEFKTFFHGHTFTGNALACAAGIASLRVFEEEKTLESLPAKISRLAAGLENLKSLPHVGDVRQVGVMAGIELVRDKATAAPFSPEEQVGHRVCMKAREFGVILRPLGDVIVLNPPLCVSETQIDELTAAVGRAIALTLEAE